MGFIAGVSLAPDLQDRATDLEFTLDTNISVCYAKLGMADHALQFAEKSLAIKSTHFKAHLRKAEALLMKNSFDMAKASFEDTRKYCGDDAGAIKKIKEGLAVIHNHERRENDKQRKLFKNIFDKANASDEHDAKALS